MKSNLSNTANSSSDKSRIVNTIIEVSNGEEDNQTMVLDKTINYPIKGTEVKSHPQAKEMLSIHENTEVAEYDLIYYLAPPDKKCKPTKLERLVNNGFDDQEGYYRLVPGD